MKNKKLIIFVSVIITIGFIILIGFNIFNKEEQINKITTTKPTSSKITSSTTNTTTSSTTTFINKETKNTINKKTTVKNNNTTTGDIKNKTTQTTTVVKRLIDSNYEYKEDSIEYKYGVKITKLNRHEILTYNDGTISDNVIDVKYEYDYSGYNANTSDLKEEGINVSNKNSSMYDEMLSYVNQYRNEAETPVSLLSIDKELNLAASIRAIEMAWSNNVSHTRPNSLGDCFTVYKDLNISYNGAGENIAMGQRSVSEVSLAWKNSPGHYENMIRDYFAYVGFGKYELNGKIYWVQMFK